VRDDLESIVLFNIPTSVYKLPQHPKKSDECFSILLRLMNVVRQTQFLLIFHHGAYKYLSSVKKHYKEFTPG
jgi:hypothetical protein